jgi:hypothetical protein
MMKNGKDLATRQPATRLDVDPGSRPTVSLRGQTMAKTSSGLDAALTPPRASAVLIVLGSLLAPAAHAGLGEAMDSVQRDHVALHGTTLVVTPMQAYDRHEITTADGTRVRQYVSRSGTVFAVAWTGRSLPDLTIVLAKHYDEYMTAATSHHTSHKVLNVATPGLVLNVTRLPRGFAGSAQLPALLPPGTSVQEFR